MKLQNQAQPDEQEDVADDQQPSIIEPYRGPLLEQLRQPEAHRQITTEEQQSPEIYEPATAHLPLWQRAIVWLMVRWLNLRDWAVRHWPWLVYVFRTEDKVLRQAKRGITILLLVGLGEIIVSLIPWFKLMRFIPIVWLFFLAFGVFYSASAALYYHRSQQPRLALTLSIIGHLLAVICFLLPLLFY